jgi:glucokinase
MDADDNLTVVGVDLGGTKILARMVDPSTGRARGRVKTRTPAGPDAVLDAVVDTVTRLEGWERAEAVGIGVPGFVTRDGVVDRCPNIAGWDQPVPVAERLGERLGKPVVAANDVNCAAVGEHRLGSGRGHTSLLVVFVGTGVGGGLIIDDRLVAGDRGKAAEIGHVTVAPGGRACGCGGRGHLECYAGRAGIEREVRRRVADGRVELLDELAGAGPIKSRHLATAMEAGDETTRQLLAEATDALALVIGNASALLDLPRVVLGGGVVDRLGQAFVDDIVASSHFGGFGSETVEVVMAHRLDDGGVVGAAALAADRLGAIDR